ncbi:hypothetical protein [Paraburkholderia sp. BL21I4N1]|uniref:hypothetical protein n=1 Tax=Paraburkholderia sp. BL21I4N1 TaxID=1938801 RepID=UPI0011B22AB1|nr:hypothetical protein [Paraburkholderia sp. BL21I4N1]
MKKDPNGPCAVRQSGETGASAPVFFRPQVDGRLNFTMWEIFLRRKKSCCTAQDPLLQDGKNRFLMRNDNPNQLILNRNKYHKKPSARLLRQHRFA